MSRRWGVRAVARVVLVGVLALAFVASSSRVADAGLDWCEDDPVIHVGDQVAHASVGFRASDRAAVTGPIRYVIEVPASKAAATRVDASMATLPTVASVRAVPDATFRATWGPGVDIVVRVTVTASRTFATMTTVSVGRSDKARRHGYSNVTTAVPFDLDR